ncbi:MAG: ABC transporter substrate-binding protein [Ilumatobacteraceae bacterium]|jgi:iron complex transport system substrate-binding protein|nr:ABC transporter substrate-binding protein [Ilumatobacteraceae bacterium]
MKNTHSLRRRAFSLIAASAFLFSACGGATESSDTTSPENSLKIVSLSPTATEMLYAIGAGDQVVAVDSLSTYPAEVAPKVTKISAYEPSAEAILAYEPDVVLISNDMNKITEQLTTADPEIDVWTGAAASSIEDVYTQITQLGELTGRVDAAADVVEDMKERIDAAVPNEAPAVSYKAFYELDNTYYSVTSNTFVGALLKQIGFNSIADGVEEGNDYPQLSAEAIVAADPDVIFLADTKCCQQTAETVAARPGWGDIAAVKNDGVVELDDDIASRWGPRIVDLIEQFAAAYEALQKQG